MASWSGLRPPAAVGATTGPSPTGAVWAEAAPLIASVSTAAPARSPIRIVIRPIPCCGVRLNTASAPAKPLAERAASGDNRDE